MLEYQNKKKVLLHPLQERSILLKNIEKEMRKKNIQTEVDEKNGVLKLKDLHYFSKGSYKLSLKGEKDFQKIRKIFESLICYSDLANPTTKDKWIKKPGGKNNFDKWKNFCNNSKKYRNKSGVIDSILIEGHADSTPIGKKLRRKGIKTNIELAMKRAQTVYSFLTNYTEATKKSKEDGGYLYFLSNKQGLPLFGVTSYGNLRRNQKRDRSPSSEEKDRRINIRFIMSQPKGLTKELENKK